MRLSKRGEYGLRAMIDLATQLNSPGDRASVNCNVVPLSHMAYEPCGCPNEKTCGLRLVMLDVRNAIADIPDGTTLANVINRVDLACALMDG